MRLNVIVVWIQCLLVDIIRHAGTLGHWRQAMLTSVHQNCDLTGDGLRGLQTVKSAKQRADVVENSNLDGENISTNTNFTNEYSNNLVYIPLFMTFFKKITSSAVYSSKDISYTQKIHPTLYL